MAKEANTKKDEKKGATTATAKKDAPKKSLEKEPSAKKAVEPGKEVTAEDLTTKLQAAEASNAKKQLAENKRLYNRCIKQIDSAYKNMERCYLETAFSLHMIYKKQLYKIDNFKNIYDFAKERYNIARGTCNTFINICERFGVKNENGNISYLADKYEEYSASQLSVMLTFPVALLNRCDSKMSVRELKRMKNEFLEEQEMHKAILDGRKEPEKAGNENSPISDMTPDDVTGGDIAGDVGTGTAGESPMNSPVKLDIPKNCNSVHICTAKDFTELSGLFGVIEETYRDITLGNKKKKARIRVDVILE